MAKTPLCRASRHPNRTAESAWDYGIWLGKCIRSDEHCVGTATGIYRTRTIRRLPSTDRYNRELLESVTSTPWETNGIGKTPTPFFVLPRDDNNGHNQADDGKHTTKPTKETAQQRSTHSFALPDRMIVFVCEIFHTQK